MSKDKKGNFNKAVFDMFGVGSASETAAEVSAVSDEPVAAPRTEAKPVAAAPVAAAVAPKSTEVFHAAPAASSPSTYLAAGTYFEGTLKSKGDVEIAGTFSGEIESEGNVTIRTKLVGNITAANLRVVDCEMEGDCHVSGRLEVTEKSQVTGNFFAGDMTCAGAITGDTVVNNSVTLAPTAKVKGDITTGTLTIERGAFIDGKLSMNK